MGITPQNWIKNETRTQVKAVKLRVSIINRSTLADRSTQVTR